MNDPRGDVKERRPIDVTKVAVDTYTGVGGLLKCMGIPERWRLRKQLPNASEVGWYLLSKAAFRVRNATLLSGLMAEARRYCETFDCTAITQQQLTVLQFEAVAFAMDISKAEEDVRQHLKNDHQCNLRLRHAEMLRKGIVGRCGLRKAVLPE